MRIILTFFTTLWSTLLTILIYLEIICSILVIVNAIISAKTLGGELGKGLKKIAAGTIFYVMLFLTLLALETDVQLALSPELTRIYFIFVNIAGSALLISGFLQIRRVSKKLHLF